MRNIFLGIAVLGLIIWSTSFRASKGDLLLKDEYVRKKREGGVPNLEEAIAYWGSMFVALGPLLVMVGVIGLLVYYTL